MEEDRPDYETFPDDFAHLVKIVFEQAVDDYIKLQHPSNRVEKYLFEDWLGAVALFFDPTVELSYMLDEADRPMTLKSMIGVLLGGDDRHCRALQHYLVRESHSFWEHKYVRTIHIPATVQLNGHVYFVEHSDSVKADSKDGYDIDYDNKVIHLDRTADDSDNEELLTIAMMELMIRHEEVRLSRDSIRALGRTFFRLLKMNDCFNNHSYSAKPLALPEIPAIEIDPAACFPPDGSDYSTLCENLFYSAT